MEWIETTGKTVEEALARALRELGIDESELEYEVVQEAKAGFLGIGSSAAHVRARVRPISREKPDRRRRRKTEGRGRRGGSDRPRRDEGRRPQEGRRDDRSKRGGGGGGRGGRKRDDKPAREPAPTGKGNEERTMSDVPVEEQAEVAREFTQGLVERFGVGATVTATTEDETVVIEVEGDDLGALIGPEGATMQAMRELVRTALQRKTEGQSARVNIDVGGYEARRRAALEEFARELAQRAIDSGRAQVLEPMTPPDRKVVHDAVNEMDGVTTESEGEEPRRRVVIRPA